jgi:hypothetical protein
MVLIARKWLGIKASLENGNKIKITTHIPLLQITLRT